MKKQFLALCLAGAVAAPGAAAQAEEVVNPADVEVLIAPTANFTGTTYVRILSHPVAPGQAGTALVTFEAGSRTNWHTHPAGQTLYVTQGCGWNRVEGAPAQRICAGDVVYVRPGVRHWHGAAADQAMSHLAITEVLGGKNVEWMEPVSDEEYLKTGG